MRSSISQNFRLFQGACSEMEILYKVWRKFTELKIANEKLCISVGTGFGTCRVDVELRRRRVT